MDLPRPYHDHSQTKPISAQCLHPKHFVTSALRSLAILVIGNVQQQSEKQIQTERIEAVRAYGAHTTATHSRQPHLVMGSGFMEYGGSLGYNLGKLGTILDWIA